MIKNALVVLLVLAATLGFVFSPGGTMSAVLHIPEYTYPIPVTTAQGETLFFKAAYEHRLAMCGAQVASCLDLVVWRSLLHVLGALGIVFLLMNLGDLSLRLRVRIVVIAVLYFAFQEFYLHPRLYDQELIKGVIDFLAWSVPLALYALALLQLPHGIHSQHRGGDAQE